MIAGILLSLCLLLGSVASWEDYSIIIPSLPPPNEKLVVQNVFPKNHGNIFAIGEKTHILFGIYNGDSVPINVSAVTGSINSIQNFNLYFQNMTVARRTDTIHPGQVATIRYDFMISPQLPTEKYFLSIGAYLQTLETVQPRWHGLSVFNSTISVEEPNRLVDWDLIGLITMLAGVAAFAGYQLYASYGATQIKRTVRKSGVLKEDTNINPSAPPADAAEWLEGTALSNKPRQRKTKGKKGRGSKSGIVTTETETGGETAEEG